MPYFNSRELAGIALFSALWGVLNSIFSPIVFRMFGLPILCDMIGFALLSLTVWWVRKLGAATSVGLISTVINFIFNPSGFHFLGFTFYWGRTRKGYPIPKVMTHGKRMRSKLKNVNEWARSVRNKYRLIHIWKLFRTKLEGHIRYFGVSFNIKRVSVFVSKAVRILYKWLNRRSQRKSFNWRKFELFMSRFPLPKIKVHHLLF